jgi:hypothetical protein
MMDAVTLSVRNPRKEWNVYVVAKENIHVLMHYKHLQLIQQNTITSEHAVDKEYYVSVDVRRKIT